MNIRAVGTALLFTVVSWATPSMAGPPVEDALKLCRSDPVYGDTLRMTVAEALRNQQGSEPEDADVDAMVQLAEDTGVTKCITTLSEDPSIFQALNSLSGFAAESGWVAWRSQCGNVTSPKGPCIEAEGRAGQDLQSINADPTSQRISGICQNLLSDRKSKNAPETENRTWLACLKAGVKAHPTAHALDECRFVSAPANVPAADAVVRCFQDKAK